MANELKVNINVRFQKDGTDIKLVAADNSTFDVSGGRFIHNRKTIGTSEEALDLGEMSGSEFTFVAVNHSTLYDIKLTFASGQSNVVVLKPLEPCYFRWEADSEPYATAISGSADLEYLLIEA